MDVPLAVLADSANASQEGKLNVLGVFDRISATTVPTVHPQLTLVLILEADIAETGRTHEVSIRCMDEDGGDVLAINGSAEIKQASETVRINQIMNFRNVLFPSFGRYTFVVLVNNELKKRIPLELADAAAGG